LKPSDRRVRARFATRLLVWTIPSALMAIAILGASAYFIARKQILENVRQAVASVRDETAIGVSAYMRQRSQDLQTVAESPLFADYYNNRDYGLAQEAESYRREIERYLLNFVKRTQAYTSARYMDERGRVVCRTLGISSSKSLPFSTKLRNAAGDDRGLVVLEAGFAPIEMMIGRVNVGPSGWVSIIDSRRGLLIGRPIPSGPGWIVSSAPVPELGGSIVIVASEADFLRPLAEIKHLTGALAVVCGLLVTLAIYIRVRALTEPLGRLVSATKRITEGRLGERVFVRSGDELAALAHAFNEMAKSLQHRERELENRVRQLESLEELQSAVLGRSSKDEILRTCLQAAVRGLGFEHGELYWVEGENLTCRFSSSPTQGGTTPPPLRRRRVLLSGDDPLAVAARARRPKRLGGAIFAPLVGQDRLLGVLSMEGRREGRELTDGDRDDLMLFANAAGLAIENAQLVEELVHSEIRHRQVLDGSADAIAGLDPELKVVTWNLGAERLSGIHAAVAKGRPFVELFPKDAADTLARLFGEAQAKGSVRDAALEGIHIGGRRRDLSASCSRTAGGGWSLVLRDETEKKQLQSHLIQAEKLTVVGSLIANVAHELNNPLGAVVGYADLIRSGSIKAPDLREALEMMRHNALRCRSIIENFLLFVRRGDPKKAPVELKGVIDRALKLLADKLTKTRVEAKSFVAPGLWVRASASQLEQVAVNLLSNACDAMERQGVRQISIRASASGERISLSFEDTGTGVPDGLKEKIFEPFFTTKGEGEGTGLGLSICREIVRGHGGELICEAAEAGGAAFTLDLPAVEAPKRSQRPPARRAARRAGLKLLVVDDEPALRTMVQKALRADGHEVETAAGFEDAKRLLASREFDGVLADALLGDGTVFELYDAAGDRRPPFLVMTGDLLDPSVAAELKRRKLPWLAKPFGVDELRAAVGRAAGAPRGA
jgi:PAS domain S-box-containing protein